MVNGKMTLIIDSAKGLLTLKPSQELLNSTRYVSLHAHLYDLQHLTTTPILVSQPFAGPIKITVDAVATARRTTMTVKP